MICLSCLSKIFASEVPLAYAFPRLNRRYDTGVGIVLIQGQAEVLLSLTTHLDLEK